jgi:hypothetical protein
LFRPTTGDFVWFLPWELSGGDRAFKTPPCCVSVALRASPRGATGGLLGEEEATGTCATQGLVDLVDLQPSFTGVLGSYRVA